MLFLLPTLPMPVIVRAAHVVHSHCEQEHG